MEDIYNNPKEETLEGSIIRMNSEGMSVRNIAKEVNLSKDKVFRILKKVSQFVAENKESVAESVAVCRKESINIEELQSAKDTLEQLKRHNYYASQTFNLLKDIQGKMDNMQEEFNERINKFLNNALNNRIEAMHDTLYKKLREELKGVK